MPFYCLQSSFGFKQFLMVELLTSYENCSKPRSNIKTHLKLPFPAMPSLLVFSLFLYHVVFHCVITSLSLFLFLSLSLCSLKYRQHWNFAKIMDSLSSKYVVLLVKSLFKWLLPFAKHNLSLSLSFSFSLCMIFCKKKLQSYHPRWMK